MGTVSKLSRALAVAASLSMMSACESRVSPPVINLSSTEEFFTETLDPGGTRAFYFDITRNEYTQVTLLREGTGDPFAPLDVPLRIRLGRSAGATCDELVAVTGTPQFAAHLGRVLEAGTHCVELADEGSLTESIAFAVRIVHPTPISRPDPRTVTSSSNITPGGSASLSFSTEAPGPVTATLTALSADVTAGLGLGIVDPDGIGCLVSQVIEVTAGGGPHYSVTVEPGDYCVQVFDVGNFTDLTGYTVQLTRP